MGAVMTETDHERAERWANLAASRQSEIYDLNRRVNSYHGLVKDVLAELDAAEATGQRYVATSAIRWALRTEVKF
jgi:phage host-nuclease inhibitor protein Gam